NLPRKDGRELLAELKNDPELRSIPVIVLSSSQAERDRETAYDLQASCYITKPLQWSEFLETIRAIGDFWLTQVTLPCGRGRRAREPRVDGPPLTPVSRRAPPAGNGESQGPKVLLVEDNPGDARLVREMLAETHRSGAMLENVGRLSEGLRRLGEESFDAVLLDLGLPDSQGLEALGKLQAQATGVPLVVMTGMEDEEVAARALREGAQDYLVKGKFDGDVLVRALGHAIERTRSGKMVRYLAHHDGLTDLPNRLLFHDRLEQAVEQARRNRQTLAVLFVDLDHFKRINDTLGHAVGDELLVHVAARLRACVRATDTVARVGGDEFTILLPEIARVEDVTTVADKIMHTFASSVVLEGHEVSISLSIGASLYPHDGESAETLLKNADAAMYRAKEQGRANCQFYSFAASAQVSERLALIQGLHQAIERDELVLHYQPTIDAVSGKVTALEALLRWQRPEVGLLYPKDFLPLAEETGMIHQIGEWVLRNACTQARDWQRLGLAPLRVSVNLSCRQLHQGRTLVETFRRVLSETTLDPLRLEVEVTEEAITKDEAAAIRTLMDLHGMGIRVAIDDFGTGFASLKRLTSFSFGSVKIDRSFIRDVAIDPDDAAIVAAIIAMGHNLRMTVTAEGVESPEQASFLLRHQIDQMQGPYFSEPLRGDACADLIRADPFGHGHRAATESGDDAVGSHASDGAADPAVT
ncbi:MAG: EAL domain-containing protein, partial [Chloroflexi bacterium]